ncbi:MAG: hypothetical protein QXZ47_02250 [Candidatus Bathyarchaeia archaeon]
MLIFLMPFFYALTVDNLRLDIIRRELREITDYVSNTIANLYFLVNSTETLDVAMRKELIYLPSNVESFVYVLKIGERGGNAINVTAYLRDRPSVSACTWLTPGLKVDTGRNRDVVSGGRIVIVGCRRNIAGVYVWIGYG